MSSRSSRSSRRIVSATAAVAVCTLLTVPTATAAPGAPGAGAAGTAAAGSPGKARAVTAELDLDVRLLNNAVGVPVNVSLNKVESPAQRDGTVLTAKVDGVDQSGPVTLVKADVGKSVTRTDAKGATASVTLADADVHAPGLPGTTLLGLEALTATATCPVDGQPTADVVAPAKLTVLGKSVTVSLYGPTKVDVPLVGSVSVEFSKKTTTSTTAAASALEVQVAVDPLNLNVAKVTGTIRIASVSCEKPVPAAPTATPTPAPTPSDAAPVATPAAQPVADVTPSGAPSAAPGTAHAAAPQAATATPSARRTGTGTGTGTSSAAPDHLASTGGNDATAPLAAGAAALVAGGAVALWGTRRRRTAVAAHARRH
ncbi:LAETG motif-containing sortase-dependent surface protein [Kitasatospora purpeofusca]|uniref:LPXTG cell wall anchor domain-containing protein n=1 Tax=Kitasatospora purpeofusca TaxID=67352 RepID=A0ABZ1TZ46_9ACTN|nr:LAETG motif-containing sortase-dependent surface protein [Kitasatospora purpeofusca]